MHGIAMEFDELEPIVDNDTFNGCKRLQSNFNKSWMRHANKRMKWWEELGFVIHEIQTPLNYHISIFTTFKLSFELGWT
jgi:hypothetical protein